LSCGSGFESSDNSDGLYVGGGEEDEKDSGSDSSSSLQQSNYPVAASDNSAIDGGGDAIYQPKTIYQPQPNYVAPYSSSGSSSDSSASVNSYQTPINPAPSGYQSSGGIYEMSESSSYPADDTSYTNDQQSSAGNYALAARIINNRHHQTPVVLHFNDATTKSDDCVGKRCFASVLQSKQQVLSNLMSRHMI